MVPALAIDSFEELLRNREVPGSRGTRTGWQDSPPVVAILVANLQASDRHSTAIRESFHLLDVLSDKHFHFFCPGVAVFGSNERSTSFATIDSENLYFEPRAFANFVGELSSRIRHWKYDFGTDLILVDISPDGEPMYDQAMFFHVDAVVDAGLCSSSAQFCGKIASFVRNGDAGTASDIQKLLSEQFGVNWFKAMILGLFPKAVGKLARGVSALGGGRPTMSLE